MSTFWYPPNKGWGNAATVAKQKKQAAIKARNAAAGVTGYDPYESAMKSTDQILAEMLAEVSRSKEAARAKAAQEAQLELDKGKALAYGIQQLGIPANIAAIFQNAAGNQANLAQGFSGNIRDEAAAQAAQQVQALAGTGQEGAVRNQGDNMGNVAYGLGGFIPGNELSTLGAAYGAQAALEPGFALQFGAINEAKRRQEWADELRKFGDQEADVLGKKPSLYRELLGDERNWNSELYKRTQDAYKQSYDEWKDQMNLALASGAEPYKVTLANGQIRWFDKKTGKPIGPPQGPVKTSNLTYKNVNGRLVGIDPATGKIVTDVGPAGSPKPPKKDAAGEKTKPVSASTRAKALRMAEDFYYGIPDETRADGTVSKPGKDAVKYQIALRRVMALGLKLVDAQQILNTYYQRGEGGRPMFSYQERRALTKMGVKKTTLTQLSNAYLNATTPEGRAKAWEAIKALLARLS